jgi:flagellar motor protein MotB
MNHTKGTIMKRFGFISAAVLALVLGIPALAHAQQDQQDNKQDHPEQQKDQGKQQEHQQQQKDQSKQQHAQQQQQKDRNKQQEHAQQQQQKDQGKQQHAQQQPKDQNKQQEHAQHQRSNPQPQRTQQQRVVQSAWQKHGSQNWASDHRTWQQRGGYHGYRIPDDRFRGSFGPSHDFRISGLPILVVGGFPRFQYQGYWFSPVDPWPSDWGNDWYDNDDVYVNYVDNGYYLYNSRYPDVAIAINISL